MKKLFSIAFLFVFAFTAYGQTVKSITPQEQGTVALLMIQRETVTGEGIALDTTYVTFMAPKIKESVAKRTRYLDGVIAVLTNQITEVQAQLNALSAEKAKYEAAR